MTYTVQLTLKSRNAKVGAMPVSTTSNVTCPDACPLKSAGCYADAGPLGMLWRSVSQAEPGGIAKVGRNELRTLDWQGFTSAIAALPADTLWRHNQAGDLPGKGDAIDTRAMSALVDANAGKRGFTYTHKPLTGEHGASNAKAIRAANDAGFTVNLSANNLREADALAASNAGPVVVVLPADVSGNVKIETPEGRRVTVCPATYRDDVACINCGLCQRQERKAIVGFPAHGASKRKASAIALS